MTAASAPSRRLIVLGSTGSIGISTLQVVEHLRRTGALDISVVGLAAGRNADCIIQQARQFNVPALALADPQAAQRVARALPHVQVFSGPDAARQLVEASDATDLIAAIVGSAGLSATFAAIQKSMRIGLANKETLVAAGPLVTPLARRHGALLLPVDSEHSAIFQCLQSSFQAPSTSSATTTVSPALAPFSPAVLARIRRIILTASGGPFRTTPPEKMAQATVEEALAHPTWKMGAKITIDSATMMNKALEIIEAHWLFGLPPEKITVIIHPQSIAHSFVEFEDNSILAQLGPPDMRTPIQYALTWPDRPPGCSRPLDWSSFSRLDFHPPDLEKFPALRLAYKVIDAGGTAGAIFNAANEEAVAAFLERRIPFGRIVELVAQALSAVPIQPADSLETILQADAQARRFVQNQLQLQTSSSTP